MADKVFHVTLLIIIVKTLITILLHKKALQIRCAPSSWGGCLPAPPLGGEPASFMAPGLSYSPRTGEGADISGCRELPSKPVLPDSPAPHSPAADGCWGRCAQLLAPSPPLSGALPILNSAN